MASEILISGFKWTHHDARSGYQQVVDSDADYVDGGKLWGGRAEIGSFTRRLNFILAEVLTIVRALRYRAVFYLYPEQSAYFFSAPLLKLMGKTVIYTLHLGEEYWSSFSGSFLFSLKRRNLKYVDYFVVLSTQQQRVFERHFPGRVRMIPHGVWLDTELTPPPPAIPPRVCVVGDNFRDYEMLRRIITCFALRFPHISFDLVGMKYAKLGDAAHASTVTCHTRLSRTEYAQVIARSSFMLLPLHFATANNALLEAQAMGIPVLCNRIDGVTDYLPSEDYIFDDVGDLCDKVGTRLAMSTAQRATESKTLVEYVKQHFSWPVVRERIVSTCLNDGVQT
jgi:glycosyltransferase involved in cell wall biosynthesis